ncbi:MAG: hypothetical protein ACKV19_01970 [Verrucomicrobiales bacterium]
MPYKITALRDVRILAYMPQGFGSEDPRADYSGNSLRWVKIRAGQAAITGFALGVHPDYMPEDEPTQAHGFSVVKFPPQNEEKLPQEFLKVVCIDYSAESPGKD